MEYKFLTSKLYLPLLMGLALCFAGGIVLLIKPGAALPLELGLSSLICTALQRLLIFIVRTRNFSAGTILTGKA